MKQSKEKKPQRHQGNNLSAAERLNRQARELVETETSFRRTVGSTQIGLVWPGPYDAGMASLGYHWAWRSLSIPEVTSVHRYFAEQPCYEEGSPALSLDSRQALYQMDIVAVSISYELDILPLLRMLEDSGVPPLASDRTDEDPLVVIGGPLVRANPDLVEPFAEIAISGDGEGFADLLTTVLQQGTKGRQTLIEALEKAPGRVKRPKRGRIPLKTCCYAGNALPLVSPVIAPKSALGSLRLVEVTRGCPRQCTFCIGRSDNLPLRMADLNETLERIPKDSPGIGLVGAAVCYWPGLEPTLEFARSHGMTVGISSLRADKLTPSIVSALASCGTRILTVAADGASQRIRDEVGKGINQQHLLDAATWARQANMGALKLYQMIGFPDEEEEDYEEMADFCNELARIIQVVISPSVLVPKRFTPMEKADFAGVRDMDSVVKYLRGMLGPGVTMSQTSPREAAMETLLNHARVEDAPLVLDVARRGGRYADFRAVFGERLEELE